MQLKGAGQETPVGNDLFMDMVRAGSIFSELAKLLREDDIDALECLEELKKFPGLSMYRTEMHELDQSVSNYDFESAKQSLEKIALAMNIDLG
jgi:hypothetical protein